MVQSRMAKQGLTLFGMAIRSVEAIGVSTKSVFGPFAGVEKVIRSRSMMTSYLSLSSPRSTAIRSTHAPTLI